MTDHGSISPWGQYIPLNGVIVVEFLCAAEAVIDRWWAMTF